MICSLQQASDKTNGRWTKLQHQNFLLGLQTHGKNWKKIQELIGTRNGSQIRSHAQKFFLKFKKNKNIDYNLDSVDLSQKQSQLISSKIEEQSSARTTDYSYFMGKIVQYSSYQEQFDFWKVLIDHSSHKIQNKEKQNQTTKKPQKLLYDDQIQVNKSSYPQKKVKI